MGLSDLVGKCSRLLYNDSNQGALKVSNSSLGRLANILCLLAYFSATEDLAYSLKSNVNGSDFLKVY